MKLRKLALEKELAVEDGPRIQLYCDGADLEQLNDLDKCLANWYGFRTFRAIHNRGCITQLAFGYGRTEFPPADSFSSSLPNYPNTHLLMLAAENMPDLYFWASMLEPPMVKPEYAKVTGAFTGMCVYIGTRIAPFDRNGVIRGIHSFITEYETPRHKEVLEEILAGTLQKYTGFPLYEYVDSQQDHVRPITKKLA